MTDPTVRALRLSLRAQARRASAVALLAGTACVTMLLAAWWAL